MERSHGRLLLLVRYVDVGGGGMEVYKVLFPWILKLVDVLVQGCLAKGKIPGRLREHFMFHHFKSKVAILQEGPERYRGVISVGCTCSRLDSLNIGSWTSAIN